MIALVFRPLVGTGHREVGGGRVAGVTRPEVGGREVGREVGWVLGRVGGGRWASGRHTAGTVAITLVFRPLGSARASAREGAADARDTVHDS